MQARRNARLAAVQAIFQYYFLKQNINVVVEEFSQYRLNDKKKIDYDFFCKIVLGVDNKRELIQNYIKNSLSDKWIMERLDFTMQAVISLGVFELLSCNSIPAKVVINEYVSIASLYFNKTNTGFVNGILDSLSKIVRVKKVING